ncbi:DUF179 domain-containing protein [Egibacter rhizosphaerae]|uniref:UPF0301 protein ER308_16060 n=1 Tax=Egibacter rhizosphaerae TaxID=1670831 RepID=A0A411YI53_9ACTN|nr:YqgE/AlgH family protein [Egibacter rhizosphaerae]QBI20938.1 DUF179 domain-containing protein [Egibacter rhizosphaerae]
MPAPDADARPLTGRLVVAAPDLSDPNFAHTVVLVLDQHDEGVLGVVLNRPSAVEVADVLPEWGEVVAPPGQVFVGGPVQTEEVTIGLGRVPHGTADPEEIIPGLAVVDLAQGPAGVTERARVFAGYAGWDAGQLEQERADGGWFIVDAEPDDAVSPEPERLWRTVLQRQGGVFTTIPEDPGRN